MAALRAIDERNNSNNEKNAEEEKQKYVLVFVVLKAYILMCSESYIFFGVAERRTCSLCIEQESHR